MNNNNKVLEDKLPKNCCTFCSHLSLEGPDESYRYYIKCIINDSIPNPSDYCKYFKQEHTHLNKDDLDDLYLNFLETSLRIKYEDYLNSIYWKVFKENILNKHDNSCSICKSKNNVDVYHINKNLGRETDEDVIVLCPLCYPKYK
ncbi:MAG: hypothetical protein RSD36_01790 [Terrisporobacter sp.]